ncbi:Signal recognition particle 54 kDa protein, chloroplastic [Hordeum vulgare]|nr:Signal recognition particle 54 kDa protein, chloroplastic [Hordeum vulgare]
MHMDGFYKELFAARTRSGIALAYSILDRGQRVTAVENRALLTPFEEEEVPTIIKGMNPYSAPGREGLSVRFSQTFWHSIKGEIVALFHEFEQGVSNLSRLNFGIIFLTPKVPGASDIRQFRPITVINVIFRILAKGYTSRAALLAPRITHPNQKAFVKGHLILDGILVLHEVIHEIKAKRFCTVFLKIDFHKAYDTIHWSFVREMMTKKGFDRF